jgi:CHAT domain
MPVLFSKFEMLRSGFLQIATVFAFCSSAIRFAGPGRRSVSTLGATSPTCLPNESSDSFLHNEIFQGANLCAGRYDEAARQADCVSNLLAQAHNPRMSARTRGNGGAVQLATRQYRAAPCSFFILRRLAESAGDDRHNRHARCESRFQGTIAHSLAGRWVAETLRPAEISGWRAGAQLAALSARNSAEGAVRPGTGLLGLRGAWLAAGAGKATGSRRAVPDDSGALFSVLYRNLGPGGLPPAEALRATQLEMLHWGGWRARPQFWGAYFAMGKE